MSLPSCARLAGNELIVVLEHDFAHEDVGARSARAEDVFELALIEPSDGRGRDRAAVGDQHTRPMEKRSRKRSTTGNLVVTSAVFPATARCRSAGRRRRRRGSSASGRADSPWSSASSSSTFDQQHLVGELGARGDERSKGPVAARPRLTTPLLRTTAPSRLFSTICT